MSWCVGVGVGERVSSVTVYFEWMVSHPRPCPQLITHNYSPLHRTYIKEYEKYDPSISHSISWIWFMSAVKE